MILVDQIALALCALTESSHSADWPYIMGVILNRADDGYRGHSVRDVVLHPYQFSRFNGAHSQERAALEGSDPQQVESAVLALVQSSSRYSEASYNAALVLSGKMIEDCMGNLNPWRNGAVDHARAPYVYHYYSPVSMPDGAEPTWYDETKEVFVDAISSKRFRWFHDIP